MTDDDVISYLKKDFIKWDEYADGVINEKGDILIRYPADNVLFVSRLKNLIDNSPLRNKQVKENNMRLALQMLSGSIDNESLLEALQVNGFIHQ